MIVIILLLMVASIAIQMNTDQEMRRKSVEREYVIETNESKLSCLSSLLKTSSSASSSQAPGLTFWKREPKMKARKLNIYSSQVVPGITKIEGVEPRRYDTMVSVYRVDSIRKTSHAGEGKRCPWVGQR